MSRLDWPLLVPLLFRDMLSVCSMVICMQHSVLSIKKMLSFHQTMYTMIMAVITKQQQKHDDEHASILICVPNYATLSDSTYRLVCAALFTNFTDGQHLQTYRL